MIVGNNPHNLHTSVKAKLKVQYASSRLLGFAGLRSGAGGRELGLKVWDFGNFNTNRLKS